MSVQKLKNMFPGFAFSVIKTKDCVSLHISSGPVEPVWANEEYRKLRFQLVSHSFGMNPTMVDDLFRFISNEFYEMYDAPRKYVYFGINPQRPYTVTV